MQQENLLTYFFWDFARSGYSDHDKINFSMGFHMSVDVFVCPLLARCWCRPASSWQQKMLFHPAPLSQSSHCLPDSPHSPLVPPSLSSQLSFPFLIVITVLLSLPHSTYSPHSRLVPPSQASCPFLTVITVLTLPHSQSSQSSCPSLTVLPIPPFTANLSRLFRDLGQ